MTNKTEIECYFKSKDMAELCQDSDDIIIYFSATYPPDALPVFDISASSYNTASLTTKAAKGAVTNDAGGTKPGCPKPC